MLGLDVLLGGLTGLLGNAVTGIMNYKTMKLKMTHERDMVKLETEAMKEEAKMQIEVTKAEIEGAVELADTQAYIASQKSGNTQMFSEKFLDLLFSVKGWMRFISIPFAVIIAFLFSIVDFLRGFMRPGLTLYLTGVTTVITWMAWEILQKNGIGSLTAAEAKEIFQQVISIVIYLTVSCVTWWFGDRRMAKFLTKLNKKGG
jgi:hypothetical protein